MAGTQIGTSHFASALLMTAEPSFHDGQIQDPLATLTYSKHGMSFAQAALFLLQVRVIVPMASLPTFILKGSVGSTDRYPDVASLSPPY